MGDHLQVGKPTCNQLLSHLSLPSLWVHKAFLAGVRQDTFTCVGYTVNCGPIRQVMSCSSEACFPQRATDIV